MNIPLYDYQYEVLKLDSFIKAMVGGFNSGKSHLLAVRAIMFCASNPGLEGGIVSPSLPMAKRSIIPTMQGLLKLHRIPHKYNKSEHSFNIYGAKIWIMSGHDPDNLKGPNFGWGGIDEPFLQSRAVLDFMLSRVRVAESTMLELLLTGTPEQLNWGYDILEGANKLQDAKYRRVSSRWNPKSTKQYIGVMERTYTKEMARAYLDGEFVMFTGTTAYCMFDERENVKDWVVYDTRLPLVLTCDFNRSPMCWDIQQERPAWLETTGGRIQWADTWVIDEMHIAGTSTRSAAEQFALRYGRRGIGHKGPVLVSGDYSGTASTTRSDETDFSDIMAILAKEFKPENIELQIRPNPLQRSRINVTNAEFLSANGERHMFISPSCGHTIRDYKNAQFKGGTKELDKKTYEPHHADACDYRVWHKVQSIIESLA